MEVKRSIRSGALYLSIACGSAVLTALIGWYYVRPFVYLGDRVAAGHSHSLSQPDLTVLKPNLDVPEFRTESAAQTLRLSSIAELSSDEITRHLSDITRDPLLRNECANILVRRIGGSRFLSLALFLAENPDEVPDMLGFWAQYIADTTLLAEPADERRAVAISALRRLMAASGNPNASSRAMLGLERIGDPHIDREALEILSRIDAHPPEMIIAALHVVRERALPQRDEIALSVLKAEKRLPIRVVAISIASGTTNAELRSAIRASADSSHARERAAAMRIIPQSDAKDTL